VVTNQGDELPDGFKMTEIGPLPEEWATTRLGDLFDTKQGKALSPEHRRGISPRPFLRTANVFWGYLDLANVDSMDFTDAEVSQLKLTPNDLLVCEGGDIGRTAIWRGELELCCYQNHLHRLRPTSDNTYPPFFMYWMQAAYLLLGLYGGTGNKTTIPNLSQSRLKSFVLPCPPLPEQKAIARVLSAIQKAVEAQDKIIAAARQLKKSLMHHLFTYGPVPFAEAEKVPLKETEIGLVPEHWDVVRLGDEIDKPEYGYTATASSAMIGPKFLRITDIQNSGVDWVSVPYCACSPMEEGKYRLQSGDILFARIGATTGKTYLIKDSPPAIFASYLIRVRCKSSLLPDYLGQFTTIDRYWNQINASKGGRLKQGINIPALQGLLVPFPSLPEQQEIVLMLCSVDKKIEAEENRKAALRNLFKTMLHQLMTGKVRVKDLEVTAA